MTATVYKYRFDPDSQPYVDDFGQEQIFNPIVKLPSDVSGAEATSILSCVQAVARTENATCSSGRLFTPRKLVFRRSNGNSFSLVIPDRETITTYARCVKNLFENKSEKIVCIEYIGEKHTNIKERFSVSVSPPLPIQRIEPPSTESKSTLYYTGYMSEYATESGRVFSQVQSLNFKSQTRVKDSPLSELASYFSTCVGEIATQFCATKTSIEYRRFNVGFSVALGETGNESNIQYVTAPSIAANSNQLKDCAEALAAINSAACIEYQGEINKRLHLSL